MDWLLQGGDPSWELDSTGDLEPCGPYMSRGDALGRGGPVTAVLLEEEEEVFDAGGGDPTAVIFLV